MNSFKRIILLGLFLLICAGSKSQTWSALGQGVNGTATCLAVYNGDVYVGGSFSMAGTVPANNIARWNGSAWAALGAGTNSDVGGMYVYNGELYVAGMFSSAGGHVARGIAKWNGTVWDTVGGGVLGSWAGALTEYNQDLIVGGTINHVETHIPVHCLGKWNSSNGWSAVGSGVRHSYSNLTIVEALAVYNGDLYATGMFDSAGTCLAYNIARWDGTNWSAADVGFFSEGTALKVFNGWLYVGGGINYVGSNNLLANGIARFDGTNWLTVSTGANRPVCALEVYDNQLYAGGKFTTAGPGYASHIASYDGNNWWNAGSGTDSTVYALLSYNGDLYVAGDFLNAGGNPANHIAKWSVPGAGIAEMSNRISLQVFPNPSSGSVKIQAGHLQPGKLKLQLEDIGGRLILEKNIECSSSSLSEELTLDDVPAGMYFLRLENGGGLSVTKLIKE